MPALANAEAKRLLDASLGLATYTAPTGSMKLALMVTAGSSSSAGTEVSGGSYARQNISFGTSSTTGSGATVSNNAAINFTNMPDTSGNNVDAVEVYDSAGTPRRAWFGSLTTPRTTAAGDTLSFASGALTFTIG